MAIESAPRVLKLYANRTNLGFSDAGDIEPTQTIELTESDLGRDIELRFVKFQRVQSITVCLFIAPSTVQAAHVLLRRTQIFVEENNGAEETEISSLKLIGTQPFRCPYPVWKRLN